MPLVLNSIPGALDANTYATIAEANTYNDSVMTPDAWTNAEVPTKNRALATATRLIDTNVSFKGQRTYRGQALSWPRQFAIDERHPLYYLDSAIVPREIKDATAELARRLIEGGMPDTASETEGLKSLKAGPVELEWFEGANVREMIDRYVLDMISHLAISDSSSTSIVVPLIRV